MNARTVSWCLVTFIWLFGTLERAWCCRMMDGYQPPTNFEIVKNAEFIVLGTALRFDETADGVSVAVFSIDEALKGEVHTTTLTVEGFNDFYGKSDENDFSEPRPGTWRGACVAIDFRRGKQYLLFIKPGERIWWVSAPAFTRASEEVSGAESPWVVTVRHYVRIAAKNDYEQEKAALTRLHKLAISDVDRRLIPIGLAEDIGRHMVTPTYFKSYSDLKLILENAQSNEARERALWALAWTTSDEATEFLEELVNSPNGQNHQNKYSVHIMRKEYVPLLGGITPCDDD